MFWKIQKRLIDVYGSKEAVCRVLDCSVTQLDHRVKEGNGNPGYTLTEAIALELCGPDELRKHVSARDLLTPLSPHHDDRLHNAGWYRRASRARDQMSENHEANPHDAFYL